MTPLEDERRRQTHDKLWTNVAAACRSRNTRKGNRTPEEARMPLLYVPCRFHFSVLQPDADSSG